MCIFFTQSPHQFAWSWCFCIKYYSALTWLHTNMCKFSGTELEVIRLFQQSQKNVYVLLCCRLLPLFCTLRLKQCVLCLKHCLVAHTVEVTETKTRGPPCPFILLRYSPSISMHTPFSNGLCRRLQPGPQWNRGLLCTSVTHEWTL